MRDIDKLFLVFLALCAVLVWVGSILDRDVTNSRGAGIYLNGPANISVGNNSAVFGVGAFDWNQSYISDLKYNRSIHIAANATENWTIWKGDEVVCYIPRGA